MTPGVFLGVFFFNFFKKYFYKNNNTMGLTYASIELVNQYDENKNQDGEIDASEICR